MLAVVVFATGRDFLNPGGGSGPAVYGQPETGKSLATVQVGAKTANFPGVVCESTDPEVVIVSLGVHDDPISFFLSAFLGPRLPDGSYIAPGTTLVVGHRPGVAFDQAGSGTLTVSTDLTSELESSRASAAITAGSMSFRGRDSTGQPLSGSVFCMAQTTIDWAALERPLVLPRIASGSTCPVTASTLATQLDPRFDAGGLPNTYRAFGNGPVYPIIYGLDASNRVRLSGITLVGKWYPDKILWLIAPDFDGPILIRGGRIDGAGQVHFAEGPVRATDSGWDVPELRFSPPFGASDTGGWLTASSGALIQSAGCFGLQVDTPSASYVIVFQATQ